MKLRRTLGTVTGGYVLTASSLLSGALGFVFWMAAARRFDAVDVGFAAAVYAFIGAVTGVGSLGMSDAYLRYVPRVGGAWGRVVFRGYGAAAAATALLTLAFGLFIAGGTGALAAVSAPKWLGFVVVAALICVIFTLQDSVLIPLRRPVFVLGENVAAAAARIAVILVGPFGSPRVFILLAWLLPTLAAVVLVNPFLILIARAARLRDAASSRPAAGIVGFCAASTLGIAATVAMTSLMPVIITTLGGARANARFFLIWGLFITLLLVGSGMAGPLAAEIARGLDDEKHATWRAVRHAVGITAALAVAAFVCAPVVLAWLGRAYQIDRWLFALLLIAAVIAATATVLLARERSHGRAALATAIHWVGAVIMISGALVAMETVGVVGVGWAVLAAEATMTTLAIIAYMIRWPTDQTGEPMEAEEFAPPPPGVPGLVTLPINNKIRAMVADAKGPVIDGHASLLNLAEDPITRSSESAGTPS
jgi:O-antigen/teichoic acid export membrane protein